MSTPCNPQKYPKTAPPDRIAVKTYAEIMQMAERDGLIMQAYGGVAIIAIPSEQRKSGNRESVLEAHQMNETLEMEP